MAARPVLQSTCCGASLGSPARDRAPRRRAASVSRAWPALRLCCQLPRARALGVPTRTRRAPRRAQRRPARRRGQPRSAGAPSSSSAAPAPRRRSSHHARRVYLQLQDRRLPRHFGAAALVANRDLARPLRVLLQDVDELANVRPARPLLLRRPSGRTCGRSGARCAAEPEVSSR